ncbi:hypothetical protein IWX49DRAFT_557065 [Phyllosticta citricarpa]|uniref:Uncharacterized protein n=2 Tax=Phyllosticta TaxID=121621 RepID=A0ABR1LE17_9PEZI
MFTPLQQSTFQPLGHSPRNRRRGEAAQTLHSHPIQSSVSPEGTNSQTYCCFGGILRSRFQQPGVVIAYDPRTFAESQATDSTHFLTRALHSHRLSRFSSVVMGPGEPLDDWPTKATYPTGYACAPEEIPQRRHGADKDDGVVDHTKFPAAGEKQHYAIVEAALLNVEASPRTRASRLRYLPGSPNFGPSFPWCRLIPEPCICFRSGLSSDRLRRVRGVREVVLTAGAFCAAIVGLAGKRVRLFVQFRRLSSVSSSGIEWRMWGFAVSKFLISQGGPKDACPEWFNFVQCQDLLFHGLFAS